MARVRLSPEQLSEASKDLYEAVSKASDLAFALIAGAFLEKALTTLLHKFFIESKITEQALDERDGLLRDFSARTRIAYCLGLVSKGMYQNLVVVGTIRNTFAHSHLPLNFKNPEIKKLCDTLTFPRIAQAVGGDKGSRSLDEWAKTPRDRFMLVVTQLYSIINLTALSLERRKESGWDW
jgi:DNA-binding MltR family transcriptional regulator